MLSADTLFHFTKNIDTLCKILDNGFRPSYCMEMFTSENSLSNCYTPMVCFCDIPLSQVHRHVDRYGKYGVGMKVDWGIKKDVNPVTYVSKDSSVYTMLEGLQTQFTFALGTNAAKEKGTIMDPFGQYEATLALSPFFYSTTLLQCYLKLYKGVDMASGLVTKFYDEKEWRYLPPFSIFPNRNPMYLRLPIYDRFKRSKGEFMIQFCEDYLGMSIEDALAEGRKIVSEYYLKFVADDIKYIIVRYEGERNDILDHVGNNSDKYSVEDANRLYSRILTYEQIKDDF